MLAEHHKKCHCPYTSHFQEKATWPVSTFEGKKQKQTLCAWLVKWFYTLSLSPFMATCFLEWWTHNQRCSVCWFLRDMTGEAGCSAVLSLAEWVDICQSSGHYSICRVWASQTLRPLSFLPLSETRKKNKFPPKPSFCPRWQSSLQMTPLPVQRHE